MVSCPLVQEAGDLAGTKVMSAVYLIPTLKDYLHLAMRNNMRVASAGTVFERIHQKGTTSGIGWV